MARERGDTLIEVTIALTILSSVLLGTISVTMHAYALGQTARERTIISMEAQKYLEDVRGFRDNHTWSQFINGSVSGVSYPGVLNGGSNSCVIQAPCFHTALQSTGSNNENVPVGGSISGSTPTSYIEMVATPDSVGSPERVDVTVNYGFDTFGGTTKETGHIKTVFVDLGFKLAASPPPCVGATKDIIFDLDASLSMLTNWETVTRAVELSKVVGLFLDGANVSAAGNHVALVQFNDAPSLLSNFKGNATALKAAMGGYTQASGTHYTPPLTMNSPMFTAPPARPGVEQAVIFITDGLLDGPDSVAAALAAADALKAAGVRIYTIGIIQPSDPNFAAATGLLQSMVGNGGTYANAISQADLESIMNDLSGVATNGC